MACTKMTCLLGCCTAQSGRNMTDVSKVLTASIITLIMQAVSTSEMVINFYQTTQHNIPDDKSFSKLYVY
jgi:hypothetical protein